MDLCEKCGKEFDQVWWSTLYLLCKDCAIEKLIEWNVPVIYRQASVAGLWTDPKKESLFFHGPVGVGKTYAAYAKVIEMIRGGVVPKIVKFDDVLRRLRACFQEGGTETEREVINDYANVMHLVIDDFGGLRGEKVSAFTLSAIFQIVDHRNECRKQTDVTSNKTLDELAADFDDRITSRLFQLCRVVPMKGGDRRVG